MVYLSLTHISKKSWKSVRYLNRVYRLSFFRIGCCKVLVFTRYIFLFHLMIFVGLVMTDVHEFNKKNWNKILCRFFFSLAIILTVKTNTCAELLITFCYIHKQIAKSLWMLGLGCYFISGGRKYSYSSYLEKAISVPSSFSSKSWLGCREQGTCRYHAFKLQSNSISCVIYKGEVNV